MGFKTHDNFPFDNFPLKLSLWIADIVACLISFVIFVEGKIFTNFRFSKLNIMLFGFFVQVLEKHRTLNEE